MSLSRDPTLRGLDDCGCCEGLGLEAPEVIDNRPGLSAIAYRIGTHSRFKASLLSRLSAADLPALNDLTTRADGDFTIALLDAWAAVADVLAFYQERIANESYVRTATERRSLAELAGLIGYRPRPGVAASAYLAFQLDETGKPDDVPVPVGTRVQSIPGPGESPQVFETVEPIAGRAEWNAMRPLLRQKHPDLTPETKSVTVRSTATNVQKGDSMLLLCGAGAANRVVKRVLNVAPDPVAQTTQIDLDEDPPDPPRFQLLALPLATWRPVPTRLTAVAVTSRVLSGSWKQADLKAYAVVQSWPLRKLSAGIASLVRVAMASWPPETGAFAFRVRASIFGHNAPKYTTLPATQRLTDYVTGSDGKLQPVSPPYPASWEGRRLDQEPGGGAAEIDLDSTYPGIVKGSYLVLENATARAVYRVQDNTELSRTDYTLAAKVTRVRLDSATAFASFGVRNASVLAQSAKLDLAELPITDAVAGSRIVLDGVYLGLRTGRAVVVSGRRTDLKDVVDSEVMIVAEVLFSQGYTELVFVRSLANEYERASVTINANVALATHGESREQALGSGDPGRPFQQFALPESPLTYVSAENASGAATTLRVRVNQLLWSEVESFHGRGPDDRVYTTRTDEAGRTLVQFGDGRTGARPPSGLENVVASYRKGVGLDGLVDEGQLSLLLTRPLGVRGAVNPVASGDAEAPEGRDAIRRNAALPIRALDRIVSLSDYEDFASAFAGVAKALATWTWDGHRRGVFVTIAGPGGQAVPEGSVTHRNLLAAMLQAGDPSVPLRIKSYTPAFFRLSAGLGIDPAYLPDRVRAVVAAALRAAFAFEARGFGQPVARSEVIAAMQAVEGVVAVDLDALHRVDATLESLADRLTAQVPRAGTDVAVAAELLLLDPRPIPLGAMTE